MSTAYLLINVGTPAEPQAEAVGKYLSEFLNDGEVIRLPRFFRKILVDALIVPRRKKISAKNYQKIWLPEGSPLFVYSQRLVAKLNETLPSQQKAFLCMRYGKPDIASSLKQIQAEGFKNLVFVPLYPQYARATTQTSIDKLKQELLHQKLKFNQVLTLPPFYSEDFFIHPQVEMLKPLIPNFDHVLFSYHGLPESHIHSEPGCRLDTKCCERPMEQINTCYYAQCLQTTQILQRHLGLSKINSSTSFQSRLGRAKWLGPATQNCLQQLPKEGCKKLLVICPSFVTDCLETLEEINREGRDLFLQAGGKEFQCVPCLNYDPLWVQGLGLHLQSFSTKNGLLK